MRPNSSLIATGPAVILFISGATCRTPAICPRAFRSSSRRRARRPTSRWSTANNSAGAAWGRCAAISNPRNWATTGFSARRKCAVLRSAACWANGRRVAVLSLRRRRLADDRRSAARAAIQFKLASVGAGTRIKLEDHLNGSLDVGLPLDNGPQDQRLRGAPHLPPLGRILSL
jgi:hypothetical protein